MNTDTPIKLTNPLSDKPTEMWMQAIADFEAVLGTTGYEIHMGHWYVSREDKVCMVCMAGASMVRRTGGLARHVTPKDYPEQDGRKLQSINEMSEGRFEPAIDWLVLPWYEAAKGVVSPWEEEAKWLGAIQAADLTGLVGSIRDANEAHDWHGLIRLLREAIARIDTEYTRLHENTPHCE